MCSGGGNERQKQGFGKHKAGKVVHHDVKGMVCNILQRAASDEQRRQNPGNAQPEQNGEEAYGIYGGRRGLDGVQPRRDMVIAGEFLGQAGQGGENDKQVKRRGDSIVFGEDVPVKKAECKSGHEVERAQSGQCQGAGAVVFGGVRQGKAAESQRQDEKYNGGQEKTAGLRPGRRG